MPMTNKEMATKAMEYARSFVLKGFTQLAQKNERLDTEEYINISRGLKDIRHIHESNAGIHLARVDPDEDIYKFELMINDTEKYSLGNCQELAFLALKFVVDFNSKNENTPFDAEVTK